VVERRLKNDRNGCESIRVSLVNYQRVVMLKGKDTSHYLPIFIGASEADAIAIKLQGSQYQDPMTHDLMRSIIEELGSTVVYIVINDLQKDVFFAKVVLNRNGDRWNRFPSSDAIALAVRVKVPIYAEEMSWTEAAIWLDQKTGKPVDEEAEAQANPEGKTGY